MRRLSVRPVTTPGTSYRAPGRRLCQPRPALPSRRKRSPGPRSQSGPRRPCQRMRSLPRHAAGSHLGVWRGASRCGVGQGGKVHARRCAAPRPGTAAHAREALPARQEATVWEGSVPALCPRVSGGGALRGGATCDHALPRAGPGRAPCQARAGQRCLATRWGSRVPRPGSCPLRRPSGAAVPPPGSSRATDVQGHCLCSLPLCPCN